MTAAMIPAPFSSAVPDSVTLNVLKVMCFSSSFAKRRALGLHLLAHADAVQGALELVEGDEVGDGGRVVPTS
jgi:hypothetical protein